jgi:hypothetical protein
MEIKYFRYVLNNKDVAPVLTANVWCPTFRSLFSVFPAYELTPQPQRSKS